MTVVAVVGPTASGKTVLAEGLARTLGGEIVSADSMQVYRGMDVGTCKPPEPRSVTYHCLDLIEPGEPYSAARFQADARCAIQDIHDRERLPIVAGGTGLYLRAALDDWEIPQGHGGTDVRRGLELELREIGPAAMHARLTRVDPGAARVIHPNNSRRVIRALEMTASGVSYADQAARFSRRRSIYETTFLGLTMDRRSLYERIDRRVDAMVDAGLVEEVRALLAHGLRDALTAGQAIGYKELVPVIEQAADLSDAIDLIKQASRRYAKRQLTWLRADPRIAWIDVTSLDAACILDTALDLLSSD
jgi:tRNA dimethylallyltransferase